MSVSHISLSLRDYTHPTVEARSREGRRRGGKGGVVGRGVVGGVERRVGVGSGRESNRRKFYDRVYLHDDVNPAHSAELS